MIIKTGEIADVVEVSVDERGVIFGESFRLIVQVREDFEGRDEHEKEVGMELINLRMVVEELDLVEEFVGLEMDSGSSIFEAGLRAMDVAVLERPVLDHVRPDLDDVVDPDPYTM
jgi:hypothetical protein